MVKRKYTDDADDLALTPKPSYKRPAYASLISQYSSSNSVSSDMDTEMSQMDDSSPLSPWNLLGVCPPASDNALYPFPSVEDDNTMECDDQHSATTRTSNPPNSGTIKPAFDPVHARVYENRYPSDASTTSTGSGLMQPQGPQHGPQCTSIPRIIPSNYPNAQGQLSLWSKCGDCGAVEMVMGCGGAPVTTNGPQ